MDTNTVLFGFANSMFQSSKIGDCGESNWSDAINSKLVTQSNVEISHWNNFKNDIDLMKEKFNVTTYRISIEWSHIEPTLGTYDIEVLDKYKDIVQYCNSLNIKPMLTLHHFNEPLWFYRMGSFEKEENSQYFINFCKYVFTYLNSDVKLWCTFNEPAVYAFMGYTIGDFPPFNRMNFYKSMLVLKNLLATHVKVYKELKNINNHTDIEIGIVHNVLLFKKLYDYDFLSSIVVSTLNEITNDSLIRFFKTGKFIYNGFFGYNIEYENIEALNSNDFIGLNFYANPVVGPNLKNIYGATHFPDQDMGDMYLPIDPKGFSEAIDLIASLNLPIYITETGIADASDTLRQKFLLEYFSVLDRKIFDGIKIKGIYMWTFRDNYEWNQTNKLFGFNDIHNKQKISANLLRSLFMSEKNDVV